MFTQQEWILSKLPEIKNIFEKHGRPAEKLDELKKEVENFKVRLPLIGPFSAGKSTLINTLLDQDLLAIEIDPTTALPAEIHYAEQNRFSLCLEDESLIDITESDLKAPQTEHLHKKPLYVKAELASEKLQAFPHLCLVDMPGWDSGIKAHSTAIDNYINRSLAYAVVIPAGDGTLRNSIRALLAELDLYSIPVFVFITKSEKSLPEDIVAITEQIRIEIAGIMKNALFSVATISSRKKNIEPFVQSLHQLEKRSESIFNINCHRLFGKKLQMMDDYLSTLLNEENMTAEDIAMKQDKIKQEMESFRKDMERETRELKNQIDPSARRILDLVKADLHASLESLTDASLHNGDMEGIVGQIVRNATIKGMESEFHPKLKKYIKSLGDTLAATISTSFRVNFSDLEEDRSMDSMQTGIQGSLSAALLFFRTMPIVNIIAPLLVGLVSFLFGKTSSEEKLAIKREEARQQVLHSLIPGVLQKLHTSLIQILEQITEKVEGDIKKSIDEQEANMKAALDDLSRELQQSEEAFRANQAAITQDRSTLREIMTRLEGAAA
ncbi:dynamin family protein [Desulfobotulus alkaliphilus]|uniref:Dynamin family protein n=1 Tax=Desulfobotulus alkaliphilus TaxID=622671 RepID=A0A562RVF7_9BACT|nr:dynamin family protein [Desulfobotulus alkaliphilus]TWI73051.1 dynamin family protein [Desulfobotulus alkaliphilus]